MRPRVQLPAVQRGEGNKGLVPKVPAETSTGPFPSDLNVLVCSVVGTDIKPAPGRPSQGAWGLLGVVSLLKGCSALALRLGVTK